MIGQIAVHARVNNEEFHAVLPGKDVDCRAARQKIQDHLPRHFLRIRADAFRRDAVISGKDQRGRARQRRRGRLLNLSDPQGDALQQPQRAERLGFLINFLPQCCRELIRDRFNVKCSCQFHAQIYL